MRLALAQLSAGLDRQDNLRRVLEAMDQAKAKGAEVIAFPELAIDRFFPQREHDSSAASCAEPIPGPAADAVGLKLHAQGIRSAILKFANLPLRFAIPNTKLLAIFAGHHKQFNGL